MHYRLILEIIDPKMTPEVPSEDIIWSIGRDLEYWAECEKRAVNHHKKMAQMPRGKAITNYLRTAQEQLTYGVQYHRGITDKADRAWVIGVCYRGLHRYQP